MLGKVRKREIYQHKGIKEIYMISRRKYSTNAREVREAIKDLSINPKYIYDNLDSEEIRRKILKETMGSKG